jgi:hypothetical protein
MFLLRSLVQHEVLRFVFDPGTYLQQLVTMQQQLAMIQHLCVWYPDP